MAVLAGVITLPETLVRRDHGKIQQLEAVFTARVKYMAIAYTWTIVGESRPSSPRLIVPTDDCGCNLRG